MRLRNQRVSFISRAFPAWALALFACGETATRPSNAEAPEASDAGINAAAVAAVNSALKFNTSYVNVQDHNLLDLSSQWTLEAWVKPVDASTGADQDVISKWAGIATASYILQIDARGKLRLVTANGSSVRVVLSNGTLGDQTWHHVAASFSNGTVKLYINGALDRTVTGVLTPLRSTEPVAFGREGTYPGGTLNGSIDEIRIWNVPRSGLQIARFLTRRLLGTETGLVGYWRFDEGGGQVAVDATGHGLNGRLGQTTSADTWDPTWVTQTAPVY